MKLNKRPLDSYYPCVLGLSCCFLFWSSRANAPDSLIVRNTAMIFKPAFCFAALFNVALPTLGWSQDPQPTLTLDEAVQLAKKNNGDVRAAVFSEKAARARVDEARANFYPNITPTYTYNSRRVQLRNTVGGGTIFNQSEGGTTVINASFRLLDLGERQFNLRSTQEEAGAAAQQALQTLRVVLFDVYSAYYDILRYL